MNSPNNNPVFLGSAIKRVAYALAGALSDFRTPMLALLTRRARPVEDQYSVCVDGAERRYGIYNKKDNGFIQLPDGPGTCEKTVISTKGSSENTDR